MIVLLVVVTTGCGGPATEGRTTPSPSRAADPVATLVNEIEASGTQVTPLGPFNPDPLGGRGVGLCLDGQAVSVYVYATAEERAAVTARVDRADPSNIGTASMAWAGNPRFWERDRLIVLYLGHDGETVAALSDVLGQAFASGRGRDPGPDAHSCELP
jgi:hypothetical protein